MQEKLEILYPSFTMCNHFHALLLQFIDALESVSVNFTRYEKKKYLCNFFPEFPY